jgi:hypothetical protein
MYALQNIIMSDDSRLFAKIENKSLSPNLFHNFPKKNKIQIRPTANRRYKWADFKYKNEVFTAFDESGDLMLFADNCNCSEELLSEILKLID